MQLKLLTSELKNSQVTVLSDNPELNTRICDELSKNNLNVKTVSFRELRGRNRKKVKFGSGTDSEFTYYIVVFDSEKETRYEEEEWLVKELLGDPRQKPYKVLFCVFPVKTLQFENFLKRTETDLYNNLPFSTVLHLGDMVSRDTNSKVSLLDKVLDESVSKKAFKVPKKIKHFYPQDIVLTAEAIVRSLFSVGSQSKSVYYVGNPVETDKIIEILMSFIPNLRVGASGKITTIAKYGPQLEYVNFDLYTVIRHKLNSFNRPETTGKANLLSNIMVFTKNNPAIKKLLFALLTVIFVLISPIVSLFIASKAITVTDSFMANNDFNMAKRSVSVARVFLEYSEGIHIALIKIKILEQVFSKYYPHEFEVKTKLRLTNSIIEINDSLFEIIKNTDVFTGEKLHSIFTDIYLNLGSIYNDLGLIESDLEKATSALKKEDIVIFKNILDNRNSLLGTSDESEVIFLLNDNSVTRTNGGRTVAAVKAIVNGTNDLKFDFVNLESGETKKSDLKNVSGISMDYREFTLQSVSKIFGPSSDTVRTIIGVDIYAMEKIRSELGFEEEFDFKSTNIDYKGYLLETLTSLKKADQNQIARVLSEVKVLFNEKHMLLTTSVENVNKNLDDLGWGGNILRPKCGDNCYEDLAGLLENSENSGGQNLTRAIEMSLSFQTSTLKRKLTYYMENTNAHLYQSYLTLITNSDTGGSPVSIESKAGRETVFAQTGKRGFYKETKIYVSLEPGETKAIVFMWEGEMPDYDNYQLLVHKQPGLGTIPLALKAESLEREFESAGNAGSLTSGGTFGYNDDLKEDFTVSLHF